MFATSVFLRREAGAAFSVRDFVEKIEVFPDRMHFTMKAGMVTEVAM